ncbi:unnamed protein product [Darwinula stevensoni]|uniref:Vacuolar protein sorting-associated protein 16 homolog n=1 Tax=Darwinula stevensoni TaxID=69355 RepID=A0A7R8XE54_9CRUS|nr:unnamed protein product [Darwinula stevensoni]CAG0889321.1 unnamed protein product [Darwinula stevensoni]
MVEENLPKAVEQCIQAAAFEFDVSIQKLLLKAGNLGRGYLSRQNPSHFVETCQALRILAALRHTSLAIPLTYTQYQTLGTQVVVDRLVMRRKYLLAIRISKYLRIPPTDGEDRILRHWTLRQVGSPLLVPLSACPALLCIFVSPFQKKVEGRKESSKEIAHKIARKLGVNPRISYAFLAQKALESNSKDLAIKLLGYEGSASKQVPPLLQLGQYQEALQQSVVSGDPELIYLSLHEIQKNLPLGQFQLLVRDYPAAQALYMKQCQQRQKWNALMDIFIQEDNFMGQALSRIRESYSSPRIDEQLAVLMGAVDCLRRSKMGETGKNWFILTEDHVRLMKHLINSPSSSLDPCLPLQDVVHQLLLTRDSKAAEKLRSEFRIPADQYTWLELLAAGELRDWSEIQRLARNKKLPVDFDAFVDVCLAHGNLSEARRYLPKVRPENVIKYHVRAG